MTPPLEYHLFHHLRELFKQFFHWMSLCGISVIWCQSNFLNSSWSNCNYWSTTDFLIWNSWDNDLLDPPAVARGVLWNRVCLSIILYGSSLRIGSLVFSELQHGMRGPYGVVHDRDRFFEKKKKKKIVPQKWGKWAKNRVIYCIIA